MGDKFKSCILTAGLLIGGINTIKQEDNKIEQTNIKNLTIYDANIPEDYALTIIKNMPNQTILNKIINTKIFEFNDIKKIEKIELEINDENTSLSFLNDLENLKDLTLSFDIEPSKCINTIPSLLNIKKLTINTNNKTFDIKTAKTILEMMPNLEELKIGSKTIIAPKSVEMLNQLKKLTIKPQENCDINFNNLTFLDELVIETEKPYNIAIWLNTEEYKTLTDNGTKIIFEDGVEKEFKEILDQLDKIQNNLNVDKNSTDVEKLNAILIYTLDNLEYDEKVLKSIKKNDRVPKSANKFYKGGYLRATLEYDSQICGNYAALVEALSDRLYEPEKSYMLLSDSHAWNIIEIDNKKYYVDATQIDMTTVISNNKEITPQEVINYGLGQQLNWYMTKPDSDIVIQETSQAHTPNNMPTYLETKDEQEEIKNNVMI